MNAENTAEMEFSDKRIIEIFNSHKKSKIKSRKKRLLRIYKKRLLKKKFFKIQEIVKPEDKAKPHKEMMAVSSPLSVNTQETKENTFNSHSDTNLLYLNTIIDFVTQLQAFTNYNKIYAQNIHRGGYDFNLNMEILRDNMRGMQDLMKNTKQY